MDTRCPSPSSPSKPLDSFLDSDTLTKCSEHVDRATVNKWRRMVASSNNGALKAVPSSAVCQLKQWAILGLQFNLVWLVSVPTVICNFFSAKVEHVNL